MANKKKLSQSDQSDDTAGCERKEMDIAMASETYIKLSQLSQTITVECEQTFIIAE